METQHSFDPTHVLGCSRQQALEHMRGRPVTPGEVEAVAMRTYSWRRHVHDAASYWLTVGQAARLLGSSPAQVRSLLDHRRLRYVVHASGVRLMRRADVEAVARRPADWGIPRNRP